MKRPSAHKGSALLMALWIIAILSIMVLSFSTEAQMQSGINVYVRERNRANRLIEAGKVLAEIVIEGFSDVKEWSEDEKIEDLLEDDRWLLEKRELKTSSRCTIGPILVDPDHPESGTVTVDIELSDSGESNGININNLCQEKDQNYLLRWGVILSAAGIPEDFEVEDDHGRYKLTDLLIASWNDWRDSDDTVTTVDGRECGAETTWYEERYEDDKIEEEDRRFPRNGAIPDIKELAYVRGFRDYPAILTGGVLNPQEPKNNQITVQGIAKLFGTLGTAKVNVNDCTIEQLMTIPGVFPVAEAETDAEDIASSKEIAEAIIKTRSIKPDRDDIDETRTEWPYRDWNDLTTRLNDEFPDAAEELGNEAQNYFAYVPEKTSLFTITITGQSMGMWKTVVAHAYFKDKGIRYVQWQEDPNGKTIKETKK